ncbi:MAG: hypothetical protein FWG93_05890 [Oscillospiraceae bacterium]|nr:hypothetical protein [Oscillospiraceae bacterium]
MLRRFSILAAVFLLFLSACGAGERPSERIQAHHAALERFSWSGTLRVDYGGHVLDFGLECETEPEQMRLRVTSPELLRGLSATLTADGAAAALEYDGLVLETGKLPGTALSPLELIPLIRRQWSGGYVIAEAREPLRGQTVNRLTYATGNLEIDVWYAPDHTPLICEVAAGGVQVARLTLDTFN